MDHPFPIQAAAAHGDVPADVLEQARQRIRHVASHAPAPILFARVAVSHEENPSIARRVAVKATLDVNGRPVRAHVAAEHFREALDLLEEKLRRGLEILTEHRLALRVNSGLSGPHGWRHGDLPTHRPDHFPRPPEEREIVRRKTYALREIPIEEAALDLDLLDQDWELFTEPETQQDAVLHRTATGYRLMLAGPRPPTTDGLPIDLEVMTGAPTYRTEQAVPVLDLSDVPFVFFVDDDSGRGTVLYRRYDGHYGLINPGERLEEQAMRSEVSWIA